VTDPLRCGMAPSSAPQPSTALLVLTVAVACAPPAGTMLTLGKEQARKVSQLHKLLRQRWARTLVTRLHAAAELATCTCGDESRNNGLEFLRLTEPR
jgi:hypothetical protein